MKKKKEPIEENPFEPMQEPIGLLDLDLGREDLNKLVSKVNEIVNRFNKNV